MNTALLVSAEAIILTAPFSKHCRPGQPGQRLERQRVVDPPSSNTRLIALARSQPRPA